MPDLFNLLAEVRFEGPVSLEWERQWHPYLKPLDEALRQLDAYRLDRVLPPR